MDTLGTRSLTSQLADDFGWLETYCHTQADDGRALRSAGLRLAAALVRNVLAPYLDDQPAVPLHVAVVGGAGAGKSTVANFLSGAPLAEANPQAGYTRHPIAYVPHHLGIGWASQLGFLGPLRRLAEPSPSNLDADVYQVRRLPAVPDGAAVLRDVVVWDCPDMTTWASTGYVPRLLEVCGLADLIVYVASDERYNDEVPTQFLRLLLQAGKPVVVCMTKMKEADAQAMREHFQHEVLGKMPAGTVAVLAIPYLTPSQLDDPNKNAAKYRIPLLNQVGVLTAPPAAARRRAAAGGAAYLSESLEHLLGAVRHDLAAMNGWRAVVLAGQLEFEQRYRREFLSAEKFPRFDEALVRLLDLLELPGVGRIVSNILWVVRTPFRVLSELVTRHLARPNLPGPPELPVLEASLSSWLDLLHKEAVRRSAMHPLWAHLEKGFAASPVSKGPLLEQARAKFALQMKDFQVGMAGEVERTARGIYEDLEKNPALLNTLRGGKFAIEVAAIGATAATAGINWHDFILVPLVASVTQWLVELMGKQYVETQRDQARLRQMALLAQHMSAPLAEWLTQWPATGGSSFERLQHLLRRIPPAVQQVETLVGQKG